VTPNAMKDIAGFNRNQLMRRLLVQCCIAAALSRIAQAQVYAPVFKSVEMQATIAPLGEMVEGNFYGHQSIAAISKSEKAIYFFDPDSLENLILTNVVSLPDTPVAISKGREVVIESGGHKERLAKLAVLMKPHTVALVSFGIDGQPVVSERAAVDPYSTGVRAVDMETSGSLDLVAYGKFSLGISVEKNTGGGHFKSVQPIQGPLGNVPFSDIAFTDFNGDLVPDLAALDWVNRKLLIFYGRGDGTFAQPVSFPLKAEPSTLSVADLSGSGYPDIVVGYTRLAQIDIFGGDGFGRFFLRQTIKTAAPVSKFAIADFTGDGTMDIAALSLETKDIMVFSYDPLSRRFQYSGVVGAGETYDDITPFYFSNRIRADLVASSPKEKFVKVFKSAALFGKSPDMLVPICSRPDFAAIFGSDSSNILVTGNAQGQFTAKLSVGTNPMNMHSAVDWQAQGQPAITRLLSNKFPYLLTSYSNVNMLSLFEMQPGSKGVTELDAETASLPFAVNGEAEGDSASIAAAYRARPDSSVGISVFTAIEGGTEFLEHDYSVSDTQIYVSSTVAILPMPSFLRVWRLAPDSLLLACTGLKSDRTTVLLMHASDARLLNVSNSLNPLFATQGNDSLTLYSVGLGPVGSMSLNMLCSMPFDSSNFSTVKVVSRDSTFYMSYLNRVDKSVFLYSLKDERLRFVRAWRVSDEPADIAVSPYMRTIYFLNRSEAYVSIHNF
jgi:FG-GAP-like repeat